MKWLLLCCVACLAGCAGNRDRLVDSKVPAAPGADGLKSARLVYCPITKPPTADGVTPASFETSTSTVAQRVLAITYPHPDDKANAVLAEVVVVQPSAAASDGRLARIGAWADSALPGMKTGSDGALAYALDIPKSELDGLLRTMAAQGMFEQHAAPTDGERLTVAINGKQRELAITSNAALGEIAQRVERDGKLVRADSARITRLVQQQKPAKDSFYDALLK